MATATTITDPLVSAFGLVSAEIFIAITHARLNGTSTEDLEKRQAQVQAAWAEFQQEQHY